MHITCCWDITQQQGAQPDCFLRWKPLSLMSCVEGYALLGKLKAMPVHRTTVVALSWSRNLLFVLSTLFSLFDLFVIGVEYPINRILQGDIHLCQLPIFRSIHPHFLDFCNFKVINMLRGNNRLSLCCFGPFQSVMPKWLGNLLVASCIWGFLYWR